MPYEKVPYYISEMDVVPLIHHDPHGGSIIREAMSCGKVALTVDGDSGTTWVYNSYERWTLVSSENRIQKVANLIVWLIENKQERIRIEIMQEKKLKNLALWIWLRIAEQELISYNKC